MSANPLSFKPARGDVWLIDLGNMIEHEGAEIYTRHREHAGRRPCVVLSNDLFNLSSAELLIVVPLTKHDKSIPTHVRVEPPEGGLKLPSFAICEGVRSVGRQFLMRRWGVMTRPTLNAIGLQIRGLIDI